MTAPQSSPAPVISYMLVAFRPYYASRLISEIVRKTTVPYEFLIWLNCDNPKLEAYIANLASAGNPVRISGRSPENIGMAAFQHLIPLCRGRVFAQLEDDVILISRRAAEAALDVFDRYPKVKIVGAHVWQDEYTTGARPPVSLYNPMVKEEGLYEGPMDGGFTFYQRELAEIMMDTPKRRYFGLGVATHLKLIREGNVERKGWMSLKIRMLHLNGPAYHSAFPGMLDFEIAKYRMIGYHDIAKVYENARLAEIKTIFDTFDFTDMTRVREQLRELEERLPSTGDRPPGSRIEHPGPRGWWHYVR